MFKNIYIYVAKLFKYNGNCAFSYSKGMCDKTCIKEKFNKINEYDSIIVISLTVIVFVVIFRGKKG